MEMFETSSYVTKFDIIRKCGKVGESFISNLRKIYIRATSKSESMSTFGHNKGNILE